MLKGKRAIGYVRVSTSAGANGRFGLDFQKLKIKDFCQRNGIELVGEVEADVCSSGTPILNRDGLQKVISRANHEDVDMILTDSLGVLSRRVDDMFDIVNSFKLNDMRLVTLDGLIDTATTQGMLCVTATVAIYEAKKQSIYSSLQLSEQVYGESNK